MNKKILLIIALFVIFFGIIYFITEGFSQACLMAVTSARNRFTGKCEVFPDSCIPLWYKFDSTCPGGPRLFE